MIVYTFKINAGKGLLFVAICLFSACKSDSPKTELPETPIVQIEAASSEGFYDIPSPIQQVQLLQMAGATYDRNILNPLENIPKYIVSNSMALNLGVYGADMSYAAVFNQPQDVILYLDATKKLADALNIKGSFYTGIMMRMGNHCKDKDSLLQIVSDVYRRSNEALKENDQSHLSALVVAGSFIEAMYIATQGAEEVSNKEAIYERIGEFKGSVNNLVALITTVHDSDFSDILNDLKVIKAIFNETPDKKLNKEQMTKITKQVKSTRIRITNM